MKFKLVENIDSGFGNGSAMGVLNEDVLNEDQWYKVDITPNITINGTNYNDIYIWARNDKGTLGTSQVTDIFNSALAGNYRGRGKEQSFNRDVADEIKSKSVSISSITPITGLPPTFDNALSRTDRGMRREAHQSQEANIRAATGHTNENILIHHMDENEGENNLTNLIGIVDTAGLGAKDSKTLLDIGHLMCHLNQQLHGGSLKPYSYDFIAYDFITGKPNRHNLTIVFR